MMEDLMEQQVDVLMVWPIDKNAVQIKVKEAYELNIPVLTASLLSDEAMEQVEGYVGEDQVGFGRILGEAIVNHFKDSDEEQIDVVQISLTSGTLVSQQRTEGFVEAIKADPRIVILEDHFSEGSRETATQIMEAYIQKYGDQIDAAFIQGDHFGMGALNAIRDAGRSEQIVTTGVGFSLESIEYIKEGLLTYDAATNAYDWAHVMLDTALKVYSGEEISKFTYFPQRIATIDNYMDLPQPTW